MVEFKSNVVKEFVESHTADDFKNGSMWEVFNDSLCLPTDNEELVEMIPEYEDSITEAMHQFGTEQGLTIWDIVGIGIETAWRNEFEAECDKVCEYFGLDNQFSREKGR